MRDFRVSRRRRVAAAALSGVLDIFLVLLLPAGPGTAVLEVGGLCGFRWPVAVWEVWVAGGSACLSEMPLPPPPPFHYPTPSVPIKAANVSSWLIMRYTSRAVCLQGSETPLCINRAPIHKIGGDVFTNLSTGGDFWHPRQFAGEVFLVVAIFGQNVSEKINTTPTFLVSYSTDLHFCTLELQEIVNISIQQLKESESPLDLIGSSF